MIRVAVAGAAGRMGQTVCEAVLGAEGMELVGRADPLLDMALEDVLANADVVVDFTRPIPRWRTRSPACVPACTW